MQSAMKDADLTDAKWDNWVVFRCKVNVGVVFFSLDQ